MRYEQLRYLVDKTRPRSIIEVGTFQGKRAVLMCMQALQHHRRIEYIGYDLFEDATPETNAREMNGKGAGSLVAAQARLDGLQRAHPGFTYTLIKGDTRDTLHGRDVVADFVFIDGGHSVETIRGDYEAVKGSRTIVFDDYYSDGGTDISKFGCNALLARIPHRILPLKDDVTGGGAVQMAVRL